MKYLILSIAIATPALAAKDFSKPPVRFCEEAGKISAKVEDCETNDLYLEQGEKCLDALDAESKEVAGVVPAAFAANKKQKQKEKFNTSKVGYTATSASLEYLISITNTAMAEIKGYKENLMLPPDADEPEATGMSTDAYLASTDCYAMNKKNLDSLLEDFDKRLGQLKGAKQIADASGATSATSEERSKMSSGTDLIQGKEGPRAAPGLTGQEHKTIDSGVSGMEKQKKREETK